MLEITIFQLTLGLRYDIVSNICTHFPKGSGCYMKEKTERLYKLAGMQKSTSIPAQGLHLFKQMDISAEGGMRICAPSPEPRTYQQ